MPVFKYLDLGTMHITGDDAKKLDEFIELPSQEQGPMIVRKYEYGWWIWVPANDDPGDVYLKEMEKVLADKQFSSAVIGIIRYAKEKDCYWINLDQDADGEPGLPTYDW